MPEKKNNSAYSGQIMATAPKTNRPSVTKTPTPTHKPSKKKTKKPSSAPTPTPVPITTIYASNTYEAPPVSTSSTLSSLSGKIFNETTLNIIFWSLFVYVLVKLCGMIFAQRATSGGESSGLLNYSRTVDIVLLVCFVALFFGEYFMLPKDDKTNIMGYSIEYIYAYYKNTVGSLIETFIFTIVFFVLVYLFRVPMAPDVKPILVNILEHKIWILFATLFVVLFFTNVLHIEIVDILLNNNFTRYLENLPPGLGSDASGTYWLGNGNTPGPTADASGYYVDASGYYVDASSATPAPGQNQVFNLGNNLYTYEEAESVCNAYGAKLADYDQIEAAYDAGGEWCNYGWSADQMAFFPTQKSTWDKLQGSEMTKNACGRPGINGGFIGNPYVRFGANCYGVKPPSPQNWSANQIVVPPTPTPTSSPQQSESEKAAETLKRQAIINGFNLNQWSRY